MYKGLKPPWVGLEHIVHLYSTRREILSTINKLINVTYFLELLFQVTIDIGSMLLNNK